MKKSRCTQIDISWKYADSLNCGYVINLHGKFAHEYLTYENEQFGKSRIFCNELYRFNDRLIEFIIFFSFGEGKKCTRNWSIHIVCLTWFGFCSAQLRWLRDEITQKTLSLSRLFAKKKNEINTKICGKHVSHDSY